MSYEIFTTEPQSKMKEILDFLGLKLKSKEIDNCISNIRQSSIGKGNNFKKSVSQETSESISNINNKILS